MTRWLVVAAALSLASQAPAPRPVRGFPAPARAALADLEARLVAAPDEARIRQHMDQMAAEPHHAGSPASRAVADYAVRLFRQWGFDATIESFEALLPYPLERVVEMTAPLPYRLKLAEPAISEDPDSGDANQLPTYNAYSGSGDVTAPLVYVNYGLPEDYQVLRAQGIDVRGKIVIARYGKSWRGIKPKVAAENGAAGCILYSDPRDDGYFMGDAFPKGPFRPPHGVQRGSVMDIALHPGDPLSPGWPSEPGSRRLSLNDSQTLMKIPVQPVSYEDARPLLEQLGGPVAPEPWRGALPLTYHLGPGPAQVRMRLRFDNATRPLHNVIARLRGSEFPDEWVIYGNHHDAWVNGASDPVSGAAALLETGRALAQLRRQGWRPRRTIILALWDAEEFGLIGSTEWVEKHRALLQERAVAYLNSDSNGRGTLSVGGSPSLEVFFEEVLRDSRDPRSGMSLLEQRPAPGARRDAGRTQDFRLAPLGSGSDYTPFVHHAGIASANLGFSGEDSGGVYHSIYDSLYWYRRFSDGDGSYGKALAQVTGLALLRLAEAPLLPFEFTRLARNVDEAVEALREAAGPKAGAIGFEGLKAETAALRQAALLFEDEFNRGVTTRDRLQISAINRALCQSEQRLTQPQGLPRRPWYKHQIFAPGAYTGYGAKTLPGIREAIEASNWSEAAREAARVAATLRAMASHLEQIALTIRAARQ